MRRAWALLAAGAMALGVGLFLVSPSVLGRTMKVSGVNRPLNEGADDPKDIRAHNSPSLASNPLRPGNLVAANRIDTPFFACGAHVSFDGGRTWANTAVPFPNGEEAPPRCFSPDVAFAADGRLHLVFVTLAGTANVPNAVWHSSSDDGGRSLSEPTRVAGPRAFQLRLVADPTTADRLYLSWLQASETVALGFPNTENPIVVARSEDAGKTWSDALAVTPPAGRRLVAPSPGVSSNGKLYVAYLDLGEDSLDYTGAHQGRGGEAYPGSWSLQLSLSDDHGATWQESTVASRVVPTERFIAFFPPSPSLAVDPDGQHLYLSFADGREGDADVWLWASDDGGASFEERRVNDTRAGDGRSQYLPTVAVASSGRVDVMYYDRRADKENLANEVSHQSSFDHGRSFSDRLILTDRPFDSRVGFGSERGLPDLGSRLALVSSKDRAVGVWTDTRAGTEASNKQDLASASVAFAGGGAGLKLVRGAGVLIAVLAAVGVLSSIRRQQR